MNIAANLLSTNVMPDRFTEEGLLVLRASASNLPDNLIEQLVESSRQPHVMEHEADEDVGTSEAPGRFFDITSFKKWASGKSRIVYLLLDSEDIETAKVGGIIWYGQRDHAMSSDANVTFAIRIYEGFVGKGLGTPFMQATHDDLGREKLLKGGLWLDLVEGNDRAEHLYKKMGYSEVWRGEDPGHRGQRRILMQNLDVLEPLGNDLDHS